MCVLWTIALSAAHCKLLLKNGQRGASKTAQEKYPENILARTESRKLLVKMWNKQSRLATSKQTPQMDYFGTQPDHFGSRLT